MCWEFDRVGQVKSFKMTLEPKWDYKRLNLWRSDLTWNDDKTLC